MIVEFDKPDSKLSPNNKNGKSYHVYKKAKVKAFEEAKLLTRVALEKIGREIINIPSCLRIRFIHPTRRNFDIDNSLASAKAHIDGFSKALGVDDSIFTTMIITKEYQKGVSKMIFEIKENSHG